MHCPRDQHPGREIHEPVLLRRKGGVEDQAPPDDGSQSADHPPPPAEARAQAIKQLLEDLAVEKEKQTARKLAADAADKEKKLAPEIEKIEAETEAIDEKLRLEADKIEADSEANEVKTEIERAKVLHLIESSDKDRDSNNRQAMLTRRDAQAQAAAKPKKGAK